LEATYHMQIMTSGGATCRIAPILQHKRCALPKEHAWTLEWEIAQH